MFLHQAQDLFLFQKFINKIQELLSNQILLRL
jgi:hypothetical protein